MRILERLKKIGSRRHELSSRLRKGGLEEADREALLFLLRVAGGLTRLLEKKIVTVERLKRLFAKKSESSAKILKEIDKQVAAAAQAAAASTSTLPAPQASQGTPAAPIRLAKNKKPKRKGHGRLGVNAYPNAERIEARHENLKAGDPCPKCGKGKLYRHLWGLFLKLIGQPVIRAVVYAQEKLRCNACGFIFVAPLPKGVGAAPVASVTARAMIALLRYGGGMPHWRLARLQTALRTPLPPSTQWDLMKELYQDVVSPVWARLKYWAAQGDLIHNDDSTGKVLELLKEIETEREEEERSGKKSRKKTENEKAHRKIYTTGILSKLGDKKILLLFTSRRHAGDNLRDCLNERESGRPPPIQMADMLTANEPTGKKTVRGGCLGHGRRGFVDCFKAFRAHSTHVILELKIVFKNDAETKRLAMTAEERLQHHQKHSAPVMEGLKTWFTRQFDEKIVEPNSELGGAIQYMLKHWEALTLFLRVPGAPLTNDDLEREFKPVQSHLKNSLFYKTTGGAQVGDAMMSLIQTAVLNKENPFEYFVALQENARSVNERPDDWLPWNWRATLAAIAAAQAPSPPKSAERCEPGQKQMVLASRSSRR